MANSLLELRTKYDDFLRENRFAYSERIGSAIRFRPRPAESLPLAPKLARLN